MVFGALLAGAFVIVGAAGVEAVLRYREAVATAAALREGVARNAALEARRFVEDIETAVRASSASAAAAAEGLSWDFRMELLDILKASPPVDSVSALDMAGIEIARVSRHRPVDQADLKDLSATVAFQRGRSAIYHGRPFFLDGSEPRMTVAMPIEWYEGEVAGVLVAEVDLRGLSTVMAEAVAGDRGTAFVVTADGDLVAHPDLSLVLRRLRLDRGEAEAAAARLFHGEVRSSLAPVTDLDWTVQVDQPAGAVRAAARSSLLRVVLVAAVALLVLLGLGALAWTRLLRPVAALEAGSQRVLAGRFDQRVREEGGTEFRTIAAAINALADRWQKLDTSSNSRWRSAGGRSPRH